MGSLVNIERCPDTVPGAMAIVKACFPEGLASKDVEDEAWSVLCRYSEC